MINLTICVNKISMSGKQWVDFEQIFIMSMTIIFDFLFEQDSLINAPSRQNKIQGIDCPHTLSLMYCCRSISKIMKNLCAIKLTLIYPNVNSWVTYPKIKSLKWNMGNDPMTPRFPDSLNRLIIHGPQLLGIGILPNTLQSLELYYCQFTMIPDNIFPDSLTNLEIRDSYIQLSPGALPKKLIKLHLGICTNKIVFPRSITKLHLDGVFLQLELGIFPESLIELTFGKGFNQRIIPGILPPNLLHLTFGDYFDNDSAEFDTKTFPISLINLTFGRWFARILGPGILPPSCKSLTFNGLYHHPLDSLTLPDSLIELNLLGYIYTLQQIKFPPRLQCLVIRGSNYKLVSSFLPNTLTKLESGGSFNDQIPPNFLPESLQTLILGDKYNQPIYPGVLPESLLTLIFGSNYDQPIHHGVLPKSLHTLCFGHNFNQPFADNVLPDTLITLRFGEKFNQSLHSLPKSIKQIKFDKRSDNSFCHVVSEK